MSTIRTDEQGRPLIAAGDFRNFERIATVLRNAESRGNFSEIVVTVRNRPVLIVSAAEVREDDADSVDDLLAEYLEDTPSEAATEESEASGGDREPISA